MVYAVDAWREAAANIVQPENVTRYPGGFSTARPAPTNGPARLRGDILRAKSNPTVSELLVQHALEVPTNNPGSYDLSANCALAEYLAAVFVISLGLVAVGAGFGVVMVIAVRVYDKAIRGPAAVGRGARASPGSARLRR